MKNVLKGLLFSWGLLSFAILIFILAHNLEIFLDPKYSDFWENAQAFHLSESGPSAGELNQRYGEEMVTRYITGPDFSICYLPSDQAAHINLIGYLGAQSTSEGNEDDVDVSWPVVAVFILLVIYWPTVRAARNLIRMISRPICERLGHASLHFDYFQGSKWKCRNSALMAFVLVVVTSWIVALFHDQEALARQGIHFADLVASLTVLSFLTGLWLRVLTFVIDAIFISRGVNPHRIFWDELITLALTGPVLVLIYQNSWTSVLSGAVAGLGSGIAVKLLIRGKSPKTPPPLPPLPPVPAYP